MIKGSDKRAISIMIGYVLLVGFVLLMSVGIYAWLKTYVPTETIKCDDGASLFLKDYSCEGGELSLTLKNNGRFNIGGYFIHVTNDSERDLATIDLSGEITGGGTQTNNAIWFSSSQENPLTPNEEIVSVFDISSVGNVYGLEIIPIRFQEVENKIRTVACGDAKVQQEIDCY